MQKPDNSPFMLISETIYYDSLAAGEYLSIAKATFVFLG
jgi:hypothetical protein